MTSTKALDDQLDHLLGGDWALESADCDAFAEVGACIVKTAGLLAEIAESTMKSKTMGRLDARFCKKQATVRASRKAQSKNLKYIPADNEKGALRSCLKPYTRQHQNL